jgi:para-nitrobenzyl esterase
MSLLGRTRNAVPLAAALCVLAASATPAAMVAVSGDPVTTESGKISGTLLPSGVKAYLGIPYAKPPTQGLRWAAPQPLRWDGVWNADRTGPECIQILRPHDVNHYFGEEPTSEDCLYLNIWLPPKAVASAKLPVIVYIYGGGGTVGSSGMAVYGGEHVAANGAIFVSFNYRVGILGFMAHPELSREQGGHSGNYGFLDQNAALKWVRANIDRFGGDPAKVVITGQSYGAASVFAQLLSPLSKGLFRGAAMWSACIFSSDMLPAAVPLSTAEETGQEIQQRLGAADLKAMRYAPADKILALQEEHQLGANVRGLRLPSTIDGLFWTADRQTVFATHQFNDVPMIVGSNGDDLDATRNPLTTADSIAEFQETARKMFGTQSDAFLKLYPVKSDADVRRVAHEAAREMGFLRNSQACASMQAKYNKSPTFIELFVRKHPYVPGVTIADQDPATIGAYHTADVPYWFGTLHAFNSLRPTRDWTASDRSLSQLMMGSLITFAQTGSPASKELPWPAWSQANQQMMVFGDGARMETLPVARMDWLAAHPPADVPRTGKPRTTRD